MHQISSKVKVPMTYNKQAKPAAPVTQNATTRYLTKDSLQKLLERLFPGQTDFKIRVRGEFPSR